MTWISRSALPLMAAILSFPCAAADKPTVTSTVLLQSTTTGDGIALAYPAGTPQVTSRLTVFPPGAETALHRHNQPLYAYVLEGELTIYPEGQDPRRFKAGDAFMETAAWHVGRNEGTVPVKLLSVYSGAVDLPLAETRK